MSDTSELRRLAEAATPGELLPCPFCGSHDIAVNDAWVDRLMTVSRFDIYCEACGGTTDDFASLESAKSAWNRRAELDSLRAPVTMTERAFTIGDCVKKTKGSSWQGRVVGFYSTDLTPIGYCVESERESGSVQIYPEAALEAIDNGN